MSVRFLIADDYSAHQKLMTNIISMLGGTMRGASNGREALQLAQSEAFDIVLMDLQMPELGGVAAADRLIHGWASHPHRPRIVAVTADNTPERSALCRAIGMDGFIAKPYEAATLKSALQRVVIAGHCWSEGPSARAFDMKRFLKIAPDVDFDGWCAAAPDAVLAAGDDASLRADIEDQSNQLGFLSLSHLLKSHNGNGAPSNMEGAVTELRHCIAAAREALVVSRDQVLAAA